MRTTALAVLVIGLTGAVGLALLGWLFREALLGELEVSARLRGDALAADLAAGAELGRVDTEDLLAQIVTADGRVSAATPNVAGRPALEVPAPDDAVELAVPVDPGRYLVISEDLGPDAGTLLVGVSTEGVAETARAILGLAAVGLPVLLVVVAATTWTVVGRALAPVERMRREMAAISAAQLHRRVPDPPGDDEIGRLARTMNEMLGRLEDAQERQRRFVSDASHELRTPVAAIRQHAEVALAHPARSSLRELAGTVLAEDLRIQRLVSDLLLLAAADERSGPPRPHREVDLDDLVLAVAADLRAGVRLQVDTTAVSAGRVLADAAGLRRVLTNLADNAARHARGTVAFGLATRPDAIVLTVDDDGPGIPEPDRRRVLERFVRLDAARTSEAGGSGLGLAIVAQLVTAHGGRLTIGDSPLGGARVTVRLPPAR